MILALLLAWQITSCNGAEANEPRAIPAICMIEDDSEKAPHLEHIAKLSRPYWRVPIVELSRNFHTHIQVSGWVTYRKAEEDGDLHFRICDQKNLPVMDAHHCFVAEVIPAMRGAVYLPEVGEHVIAFGIARFDGEHKWQELHPVEKFVNLK